MTASGLSPGGASRRRTSDPISWYLSTIGRVPLLTPAEEIELGNQVQAMMRLTEEEPEGGYTDLQKKNPRRAPFQRTDDESQPSLGGERCQEISREGA